MGQAYYPDLAQLQKGARYGGPQTGVDSADDDEVWLVYYSLAGRMEAQMFVGQPSVVLFKS
jgi:hypothetical protein